MSVFDFAGHTLDLRQGRLRKGDDDVALRPKSLSLLTYFVENRGRVIGKEELIAALWPDVIVSDDSLSQCLKDVRRRLGDEAEGLIRTVPRRGYVLDEGRIRSRAEKGPQPGPEAPARPDRPSIAVLPFTRMGDESGQDGLSEGIAEDITRALTRSRRLFVVSRNFGFASKRRDLGADEIARELRVQYLLGGSVRVAGDRVRISTQLTEAATGELLWAESFDRQMADIFAIQDQISEAVVAHLEAALLPAEGHAVRQGRAAPVEDYHCYLQAPQTVWEWTRPYLVLTRRMFGKATAIDSGHARLYAGIVTGDRDLFERHATNPSPGTILDMAERALQRDQPLAETHAARGFALFRSGRIDEARMACEHALTLEPRSFAVHFFVASMSWTLGETGQALRSLARAADLQPDDCACPLLLMGLHPKDSPERLEWARICFERAGRAASLRPQDAGPFHRGAVALACLGHHHAAQAWMSRALAVDPEDLAVQYNAARMSVMLGDLDQAMLFLESYIRNTAWDEAVAMIRGDPELDPIREHPRYAALVAKPPAAHRTPRFASN